MEEKTIIHGERKPVVKAMIIVPVLIVSAVFFSFAILWGRYFFEETMAFQLLVIDFPLIYIYCLLLHAYSSCEIVVTDKRVYGKAIFGKRVDLPLDSISAVGTSVFRGIDVGTSSGRIKFKFVKNNTEIHTELSKLLMERQTVGKTESANGVDELKKLKELLDSGIITQEEFDAKKKQILGL